MKMYYCGSRYYDPEVKRFINADGYVSTGQGILGNNMFAYCNNNPVMYADSLGTRHEISAGAVGLGGAASLQASLAVISNVIKKTETEKNIVDGSDSFFGAGATITNVVEKSKELLPPLFPISLTQGIIEETTVSVIGDSTRPLSVYSDLNLNDPYTSSSLGAKVNICSVSIGLNLALDDVSLSASITNGDQTDTFSLRANLSKAKIGFERSRSLAWDNHTLTEYTNLSINGWIVVYALAFATTGTAVPLPA